ncbi:hypothetical protein TIFTF001_033131 [Ficus carica]|uniref:Uncharacterized protein n=1 Tax=Ficus carica TaxID=3494 RepID=A0AA88J798_FICCA|nr:hypothetical protein TIFTF001_033131 [Ficus carica]
MMSWSQCHDCGCGDLRLALVLATTNCSDFLTVVAAGICLCGGVSPRLVDAGGGSFYASAFFVTQTLPGLSRDQLYLLSGGKSVYFGQTSEAYEARIKPRKYQTFSPHRGSGERENERIREEGKIYKIM